MYHVFLTDGCLMQHSSIAESSNFCNVIRRGAFCKYYHAALSNHPSFISVEFICVSVLF